MWRDLTSSYDIIGPYFTCAKTLESKFVYACIMETIKLFHFCGLKTSLMVCDGASPNLTMIKATRGHFGAYSFKKGTFFMYYLHICIMHFHL